MPNEIRTSRGRIISFDQDREPSGEWSPLVELEQRQRAKQIYNAMLADPEIARQCRERAVEVRRREPDYIERVKDGRTRTSASGANARYASRATEGGVE